MNSQFPPNVAIAILVLLETGRNLGYAGGNNVGMRYSLEHGADFILIMAGCFTKKRSLGRENAC